MNELNPEKQRYWLAFLLDDLAVGARFDPDVLHITIIPWFVRDGEEAELIKLFHSTFTDIKGIEATVGKTSKFGPHEDVPISFIEPVDQFLDVHKTALNFFNQAGGRWAVKSSFVGREYIPHIRRRGGASLQEGEVLHLNSLSLVKASRREDNVRVVAAKVDLG